MSEFSAILDVLTSVVNFVFNLTIDCVCGAVVLASCIAVWRIPVIFDKLSQISSRNRWHELACESLFLSLADCILLPLSLLILISPLRWNHIPKLFQYKDFEFRSYVFSSCMGGLVDICAYMCGLLACMSPFGRIITIVKAQEYYFRHEIGRHLEDLTDSTTDYSMTVIRHGFETILDIFVIILLLPLLFLTPTIWSTTVGGTVELNKFVNKPDTLPSNYQYNKRQRKWYKSVRAHLFNQIFHCIMDIFCLPSFCLVMLSPLRSHSFWKHIHEENQRLERDNIYYSIRARLDITDIEYNYSFSTRRQCLTLSLLAVADLLLLPMMLPLLLTQYRYRAMRSELWPTAEVTNTSNTISQTVVQCVVPTTTQSDTVMQDGLLSTAEPVQSADTLEDPPSPHEVPPADIKAPSAPTPSNIATLQSPSALESAPTDPDTASFAAKLASAPMDSRGRGPVELSQTPLGELSQTPLGKTQYNVERSIPNKTASAPVMSAADAGIYDTLEAPAPVTTTEAVEDNQLWGIDEFALIASQAALLVTDAICLLVPLPILYLTQYRWDPVARALSDDTVFLDKTSTLYRIVLSQLSFLIWDMLLTLPGVFLLVTFYRRGPMLEILSSKARIEQEGFRLHFAVMLNCLCVLHDILLLAPLVLLLPCFLAGYRAPIVFYTIKQHISAQLAMAHTAPHGSHSTTTTTGAYYRTEIRPPWWIRGCLWRQCLYSILDFPFVVLSAIVAVTGWRAVELVRSVQYTFHKHTITYNTLSNYSTNYRSENSLRRAVGQQFLFLLRDVAIVLPAALISVSLYRLPQLLGLWLSALWSSGVALVSAPVYDVDSCRVEFPVRGGPLVQFTLREGATVTPSAGEDTPASAGSVHSWERASAVELHVIADTLWEQAARVLGQFLLSLVKGYLPLKLEDGKGVGWSEFTQSAEAFETGRTCVEDSAVNKTLWVRLDFGTTKRTTLVKKLKLMPSTAVILLQLEAYALVAREGDTGKLGREKRVVLRIKPTVQDLLTVLESTTTTTTAVVPAASTTVHTQLHGDTDTVVGTLPASACAASTLPPPPHPFSPVARKSNFVNSFHTSVLQVFLELCIDLAVLCMFLITALSPLRLIRLLVALLEPEGALPGRICTNTRRTVYHLDKHLLEYHKQVAPPLNQFLKEKLSDLFGDVYSESTNNSNNTTSRVSRGNLLRIQQNVLGYSFVDYLPSSSGSLTADITSIEAHHLRSYQRLCKSSMKALSLFPGCEVMERLLAERLELHEEITSNWYLRAAAGLQYRDLNIPTSTTSSFTTTIQQSTTTTTVQSVTQNERDKPPATIDRAHFDVVQLVLTEERDKLAQKLTSNEQRLDAHVLELSSNYSQPSTTTTTSTLSLRKRLKLCVRKCGLLTRPLMDSRKLILLSCAQALSDLAFLGLFSVLLVTVVRALPLLQELYANKRWSVLQYTTRWILIKHVKQLAHDLYHIGRFCLYTTVLIVTVGNLPRFLSHLPYHMTSYIAAANCAKEHAKHVFRAIWEVLSLCVAFRTYRILLKSLLYCAIIPGACLGEAFPFPSFPAAVRFAAGLCVWIGLLVGAVMVNIRAVVEEGESVTSEYVLDTRIALLAWCAALFGVLAGCACSVGVRPAYVKPDCHAVRRAECSWDHLLALLTGPVESIQLSAVILYFFWDFARSDHGSSSGAEGAGVVPSLGADAFAAVLLVWAPSATESDGQFQTDLSSSSDGASPRGYHSSVMVAALLVIVWALLVAAPIATSTAEGDRRRAKVLSVKTSPVYEFLMVVLTRLLSVYIIATLLRATSCVHVYNSDDDSEGHTVLSTVQSVSCGDGDWWASLASLSLLAYYLLTSSILHADDADLLHSATAATHTTVKFAPLYALCIRAAQFFVCAACFTGFYAESALSALLPILVVAIIGSLLPVIIAFTRPAYAGEKVYFSGLVCSVASVGVLRSAGFVSVVWTTIVCIVRAQSGGEVGLWASETTVYVGWAVVYIIALIVSVWEDSAIRRDWQQRLAASGLGAVTDKLLQTVQTANIHKSLYGSTLSDSTTSTAMVVGRNSTQSVQTVAFTTTRSSSRQSAPLGAYTSRILSVRGFQDLAFLLLQMEQNIPGERLSSEFLAQRHRWVGDLQSILEDPLFEDTVALSALTATAATSSQRSNPLINTAATSSEIVAALVVMQFPADRAAQAALETGNTSVDAAVEWLLQHPQQQQPSVDLESGSATAVELYTPPTTTAAGAAVVPIVLAPSVQRLLYSIELLQRGITTAPVSTHLSRSVFTILLTRKLPLDVCWLIFSYTLSIEQVSAVLLDRSLTAPQPSYYYGSNEIPKLRNKTVCKTAEFLHYASRYLRTRQNQIANTKISQ